MPIYDFECAAHGKFEALVGKCPHGCGAGMVKRLPVLSINLQGSASKNTDKMAQKMMDSFGITNMRPSQGTSAMASQGSYRWNQPEVVADGIAKSRPYSVPVDAKLELNQQVQVGINDEINPVAVMKKAGMLQPKINVVADDKVVISPKDIADANT